jgi:hypothetical protein
VRNFTQRQIQGNDRVEVVAETPARGDLPGVFHRDSV